MKAILIIVSWIQSGPFVQVQPVESMQTCQIAAQATSHMIAGQASSNLSSPHRDLTLKIYKKTGELRLLTGTLGREVARISCVPTSESEHNSN